MSAAAKSPFKRFYVRAITRKGQVIGYGVYDCVGGMESEHIRFDVTEKQPAEVALHLANMARDDRNAGIA